MRNIFHEKRAICSHRSGNCGPAGPDNAIREPRPALRGALLEAADDLRAFKDIATLRDADVERPPDAPTDRARGAAAARELGMNRLAERLEGEAG